MVYIEAGKTASAVGENRISKSAVTQSSERSVEGDKPSATSTGRSAQMVIPLVYRAHCVPGIPKTHQLDSIFTEEVRFEHKVCVVIFEYT